MSDSFGVSFVLKCGLLSGAMFFLLIVPAWAQNYHLICESPTAKLSKYLRKTDWQRQYSSRIAAEQALNQLLAELKAEGYWQVVVENRKVRLDTLFVKINLGEASRWGNLDVSKVSSIWLEKANIRPKYLLERPVKQSEIEDLQNSLLEVAENNGYPFAQVWLDSLVWQAQRLQARLRYDTGPIMHFDSLIVEGSLKVKPHFLRTYLGIDSGLVFSQARVDEAALRLKQIPYLRLKGKPEVVFDSKRAYVRLNLQKRRANRLDGIIGFLPNEAQGNNLLLTGEVNLLLHNLFASGKMLKASWQRLQTASQQILLGYEHPNFLIKNIDLSLDFQLLRQDSTFVNAERGFGLSYRLGKGRRLHSSLEYHTSRLGEATRFANIDSLPPFSSVNYLAYGLGYSINRLDDVFFPRQGFAFTTEGRFGRKNIQFSPLLADSLYQDVPLSTNQAIFATELQAFWQISPKTVIKGHLRANYLLNEYLFLNDLFRLGGLNSLRGHNENAFYASAFGLLNLEYQFFIGEESLLFIFYDQAYLRRNLPSNFSEDFPLGMGVGMRFSTRSGIFSFVYALGQSANQVIAFNRSKIHFGLVSKF